MEQMEKVEKNNICNGDCFNCVYGDCIYDDEIDEKKAKRRDTQRRYYEKNKERWQAYKREWYEKNKEHCREQKREWYRKNREKKLAYNKQHYEENKELKNKRVVSLRRQKALDAIKMDKKEAFAEIEQFMDKIRLRYRTRKALMIILEEARENGKPRKRGRKPKRVIQEQ